MYVSTRCDIRICKVLTVCEFFWNGTARSLLEFLFLEISYTIFDPTRMIDLFLDRHKKEFLNCLNISHVIGKTPDCRKK